MNSITLSGFKEFQDKLRNMNGILTREVDGVVKDAANVWSQRAKQDAPKDQGRLINEIKPIHVKAMESEVVVNVEYAAWVEWGTKTKVRVPPEIAQYAATFRGGGKRGERFATQKKIFAWMDRVGIPIEKQWFVWISIIVRGINPHPFFFIQRPIVEKQFIGDIKDILNTQH